MQTLAALSNLQVIVAVMGVGALLEAGFPFLGRPRSVRPRRAVNLTFTTVVYLVNWTLSSVAAILAVRWRPAGLMASLGWPMWVEIVVGILVLDFSASYLSHRLLHELPTLWRFHQIHHSDDFVDVTTTYRTHPVETVWRFLFTVVPTWMLGIPAPAVVIQRLVQITFGITEHSNVRLWRPLDRLLSLVIVTPNVHKVHHSRLVEETNSNYGNVLTLYDRVLGTFTPSERAFGISYGVDDVDPARVQSFSGLMGLPFTDSGTEAEPSNERASKVEHPG
jgi:sterol desaturase/sphingolipid hydroxylase (fatty acid hydroxylase superfamily)